MENSHGLQSLWAAETGPGAHVAHFMHGFCYDLFSSRRINPELHPPPTRQA